MKINEREILRLITEIKNIEDNKMGEWFLKTRKYISDSVAEQLFRKRTGLVGRMIDSSSEIGLVYDPTILRQGIDMLFKIVEGQANSKGQAELSKLYKNFADKNTRIDYLGQIIDALEIYPTIGEDVVLDIESIKSETTDPEKINLLNGYLSSVVAKTEEQIAKLNNTTNQPQ